MIGFSPYFLIEFTRFFINWNPPMIFFLVFLSNLGGFFTNWIHGFLLSFLLNLGGFFLINKTIISNAIYLLELAFKKKSNYNVMKLYNQSHDRSNLIKTILYHNSSQNWPLINHPSLDLLNFFNQLFKLSFWSTYIINLLNQSTYNWFSGTIGL